ncbi:hypothetical protein ACPWT1_20585 [Ramlibacter sp. MMS24-I3-19]|uniref:hypothetical protein n=1 Tax=Ramlibacter sp. MMS24-I3-19 TaxID=3416606 RepID=UPI003D0819A3
MLARSLEWVLGFVLAWLTLRDVFDTVVVPGRVRGLLKLSRRLVFLFLPVWKRLRRGSIGLTFAPAVLVGAFALWMLLLTTGFALMMHAMRGHFTPQLAGFGTALYVAGSALATIGLGNSEAHGAGAVVVVAAGFCGLAVVTMGVTYLLEVQGNVGQRDVGVLKITTTAGQPPSAIVLCERYAALGCHEELGTLLREGRHWCAAILQSHATHPSLIYFRSAGTAAGWPSALGTLMDLALIAEMLLDLPALRGAAVLAREEADRLGRNMTGLLALPSSPGEVDAGELEALRSRLVAAGYQLRADADWGRFAAARRDNVAAIDALAEHLGTAKVPLAREVSSQA